MFKRLLAIGLTVMLAVGIVGCGGSSKGKDNNNLKHPSLPKIPQTISSTHSGMFMRIMDGSICYADSYDPKFDSVMNYIIAYDTDLTNNVCSIAYELQSRYAGGITQDTLWSNNSPGGIPCHLQVASPQFGAIYNVEVIATGSNASASVKVIEDFNTTTNVWEVHWGIYNTQEQKFTVQYDCIYTNDGTTEHARLWRKTMGIEDRVEIFKTASIENVFMDQIDLNSIPQSNVFVCQASYYFNSDQDTTAWVTAKNNLAYFKTTGFVSICDPNNQDDAYPSVDTLDESKFDSANGMNLDHANDNHVFAINSIQ